MKKQKVFAISGSPNTDSSNHIIINNFKSATEKEFEVDFYQTLLDLPFFIPSKNVPIKVQDFLDRLDKSDIFLITSPEYIHAIPALLKNALEWIVGDERFYQKKVGFIIASTSGGEYAKESLYEILKTMSADLSDNFIMTVPGVRSVIENKNTLRQDILTQLVENFKKSFYRA